jgi:outer membrane biogenesis lipoprotein LolB
MKKGLIYLGLLFVTTLLLAACSASSPGEAAKKYAGYIQKGESQVVFQSHFGSILNLCYRTAK